MKIFYLPLFVATIFLAGCVSYAEMDPARNPNYIQNSSTGQLCRELAVRARAYDAGVRYWGQEPHEYGSREALTPYAREFVRRGFNERDVEILFGNNNSVLGTGMSLHGVYCAFPGAQIVNRSFYPGLGHTWQVHIGNFDYVYLRGDGTVDTMHVYSWN